MRGIWMTNLGAALMFYTTRLDETVAEIAKYNLNTLYPAVWNRGGTLYPSSVIKRAGGGSSLPFPDVVAGLVAQAHRQHLRIIPWFEYGLMIPANSTIARSHPEWLTHTNHQGQAWLNPVHPQVQQFLTDLIVEVVERYPVDGIQLDDHFAFPVELGYDAYTTKLYQAEHQGRKPPADFTDTEWMAWRAAYLTALMNKIVKAVKLVRPDAIVSLSPHPPRFAYSKYLQDWTRWVELGLLDEVVVQLYRAELATLESELYGELHALRRAVPMSIGLYTGPFRAAKPITAIQQEVEAVRQAEYAGVAFFCWETTLWIFKGSSPSQTEQVLHRLFSTSKS